MVYGFAQQSGGHVSIESRPGRGTAVTIVLPALPTQDDAVKGAPAEAARSGRVLLVEDEPQVRHVICTQLVDLGYAVEAASTAADALDVLTRDANFDVILAEAVLPKGMSGIELARRVREIRPDFRVLLTSGQPEHLRDQPAPPEPAAALLAKPYRHQDLAAALRQVLGPDGRPSAGGGPRRPADEGV
jgi:two-component system NtrC family sensor kinase